MQRFLLMRPIKILCFLFLLLPLNGYAQYFSKQLDLNGNVEFGAQVINIDDFLLISTVSRCGNEYTDCVSVFKVSLSGDLIIQNEIDTLDLFSLRAMLADENSFFLVSSPPLALPEQDENVILQNFDFDMQLLGQWAFGGNTQGELAKSIARNGESILITQSYKEVSTGQTRGLIQFLDNENMEVQKEVVFNEDFSIFWGGNLIVDQDEKILLPTIGRSNSIFTGLLTKIDTSGSTIWETPLNTNDFSWNLTIDVVALQNGNYAVGWHNDDGNNDWPPIVYGLNSEGEVLWEKVFPDTIGRKNINQMFPTQNGDFIGVGVDLFLGGGFDDFQGRGGWIFRMNQEGEVLWERTIADLRLRDYIPFGQEIFGGVELENGDLVFTGSIQDTFPNGVPFINNPNVWLLRLDSDGCLVPDCGNLQIILEDSIYTSIIALPPLVAENKIELFPNPVSDVLNVQLSQNLNFFWLKEEIPVEIFDVTGQKIFSKMIHDLPTEIDVRSLSAGIYFLRIGEHLTARFLKE